MRGNLFVEASSKQHLLSFPSQRSVKGEQSGASSLRDSCDAPFGEKQSHHVKGGKNNRESHELKRLCGAWMSHLQLGGQQLEKYRKSGP